MDILIGIFLGIIQLALAALGIRVSLKPLPQNQHRRFIAAFVIVGLLGIVAIIAQQYSNKKAQQDLQDRLDRIEGTGEKIRSDITIQAKKPADKPPTIINRITVNPSRPDRRIPATGRKSAVETLARKPARAFVIAPANDIEAYQLASDIWGVLKDAGWSLPGGEIANWVGPPLDPGITAAIRDTAGAEFESLQFFEHAIKPLGLVIRTAIDNDVIKGTLRVYVGPRPPN